MYETDGKEWTISVNRYCVACGWPVLSTKEEYKAWSRRHAPWGPCAIDYNSDTIFQWLNTSTHQESPSTPARPRPSSTVASRQTQEVVIVLLRGA